MANGDYVSVVESLRSNLGDEKAFSYLAFYTTGHKDLKLVDQNKPQFKSLPNSFEISARVTSQDATGGSTKDSYFYSKVPASVANFLQSPVGLIGGLGVENIELNYYLNGFSTRQQNEHSCELETPWYKLTRTIYTLKAGTHLQIKVSPRNSENLKFDLLKTIMVADSQLRICSDWGALSLVNFQPTLSVLNNDSLAQAESFLFQPADEVTKLWRARQILEKVPNIDPIEKDYLMSLYYLNQSPRDNKITFWNAKALTLVDKVLFKTPKSAAFRSLRGRILLARGEIDSALKEMTYAQTLDPNHSDVSFALFRFYQNQKNAELALKWLELAASLKSSAHRQAFYLYTLGLEMNSVKKYKEAEKFFLKMAESTSDSEYLTVAMKTLNYNENYLSAIRIGNKLEQQFKMNPYRSEEFNKEFGYSLLQQSFVLISRPQLLEDDLKNAEKMALKSKEFIPNHPDINVLLGLLYEYWGNKSQNQVQLKNAVFLLEIGLQAGQRNKEATQAALVRAKNGLAKLDSNRGPANSK